MTAAELDRLCPRDPRLIVPRRIRWATLLVVLSGRAAPLQIILTTAASVALIVALSAWEASRPRG